MRFVVSNCCVCGRDLANVPATRVTQANRKAQGKGGSAYVCPKCAAEQVRRSTRNAEVRGAATEAELEYRITIPCEYSLTGKAEFVKSKWLPCDGALKSPKYRNMMWQRKLETLDKLIASGDIVITGKVYVSVLRGSDTIESERVAYTNKAEFLTFVRELVAEHKAAIYFAKYGKTFGYDKK